MHLDTSFVSHATVHVTSSPPPLCGTGIVSRLIIGFATLIIILAVWEAAVKMGFVEALFLPTSGIVAST